MSEKSSKLLDLIKGGLSVRQAAAEIGLSARYAFAVVAKQRRMGGCHQASGCAAQTKPGLVKTVPLDELIDSERLDVRKVLRDGLLRIAEGEVARDETLRKDLGISFDRWRELSREEEFSAFRAVLPSRRVVWGRAKTVAELKKLDGVT